MIRSCWTRSTVELLIGGLSVFSSTKCFSNNHHSEEKTRTRFTTLFLPMNPCTQSTCLAILSRSYRSFLLENPNSVLEVDRLMHKKLWASHSSETSTGTMCITSESNLLSNLRSPARQIPATSIQSLPVLHQSWLQCSPVGSLSSSKTKFPANILLVLSQAMQEEFRGFSYSADFVWLSLYDHAVRNMIPLGTSLLSTNSASQIQIVLKKETWTKTINWMERKPEQERSTDLFIGMAKQKFMIWFFIHF